MTLLELLTVMVVIVILATMVTAGFSSFRTRAEKVNCSANLKNLYVGAANYLQQQGTWPQIEASAASAHDTAYAKAWIAALQPTGLSAQNWRCPSVQRLLNDPDMSKDENIRVDYIATPFDERPRTPFLWPTQPWFIERGAMHEGGNLLILTNGQITTLSEVTKLK